MPHGEEDNRNQKQLPTSCLLMLIPIVNYFLVTRDFQADVDMRQVSEALIVVTDWK
jgi:hypothetical protein